MLNHDLFRPLLSFCSVVICLETLVTVGSILLCMHVKEMEWSDKHDLALCLEASVRETYQHTFRSKERGDVWYQISVHLSGLDHTKFKVNKRSARNRLTMLITKHKAKMRQEEKASGITCEETKLDQALEEIIDKKLVDEKSSEVKMIEHVIRISFVYMGKSSSTAACASLSNLP